MKITLTGTMSCPANRLESVREALPEHIRLTRNEPGCLQFDVTEGAAGQFHVCEVFENKEAFDAHQSRAAASHWAGVTRGLPRDYKITEG